jgi:hypothetical protein
MPNVYIIGASLPAGGAYMAYQVGRLLGRHYGYLLVDVEARRAQEALLFDYDTPMRRISLSALDTEITHDDILIANPSFSSLLFGARLPGRKIMYVQGFSTFTAIDGHFDLYVSASHTVQRYLESVWGIASPLIAPFIAVNGIEPLPWRARPARSAAVFMKQATPDATLLFDYLRRGLSRRDPDIQLTQLISGRGMPQREFWRQLASVRTLVNLTLAEGFGLVPLEAMALGTMVTGLDGLSGRDYLRYGENSLTGSFRELPALADIVYRALTDEALAEACALEGQLTAQSYSYDIFREHWLTQLAQFLGRPPLYEP